ncbi:MAG: hypothetical protein JWO92_767 [Chitinophagaceae bacterium]|nr:hypothetical protein [Chitinophagaceae bacterium]MDB5223597.1 hypothetical protein [Chitinophagaceae bacterium]
MQDYINSKRQSLKTISTLLLILFVAYLPVSTFLFFIKNDAFSGYFPPKFFMSESLHAGYLPLWNPYINYGIPQYGDMSSGFWSPVTWLIAATVGYNAYTFTIEVLAYIFIGGIGIYTLTRYFNLNNKVRFIAAIAYMCCGYNVGHLQHFNWLSGAAFLPWCIWGYLLLQGNFSIKNILQSALIFYLFISSAHPGIIIGTFYFFIALSLFLFFKNENKNNISERVKKFAITNSVLLFILIMLGAGLVVGYTDILPYFTRGDKISLVQGVKHPTTPQSWISFLLPLSTVKNERFFATDISMRNIYFSITLALFFFLTIFKKNSWQKFFLYTGIAFMLLSAGGIFKTFAYKFIPLISYVRLDGEFIIFSLLCFIIIAAIQLNGFITGQKEFKGTIKWVYYAFEVILFACIAVGLYKTMSAKEGLLYSLKSITSQNGLSLKLKVLIDAMTFYDALWLQGIIQLLLLWGIKFCLREKRWNLLVRIVIADMVIATLLNLPFTGVGKASVAEVQRVLNKSPKGIPTPALQPIINNDTTGIYEKGLTGDWSMYNKQIGVVTQVPYPISLKNTKKYFETIQVNPSLNISKNDFLFTTVSNNAKPAITSFTGNKIEFTVTSPDTGQIVYQQAWYPYWFYNNGKEKKEVQQYSNAFMSIPIIKGENRIELTFEPRKVKAAMLASIIIFCLVVILLLINPAFIRRSLFPS